MAMTKRLGYPGGAVFDQPDGRYRVVASDVMQYSANDVWAALRDPALVERWAGAPVVTGPEGPTYRIESLGAELTLVASTPMSRVDVLVDVFSGRRMPVVFSVQPAQRWAVVVVTHADVPEADVTEVQSFWAGQFFNLVRASMQASAGVSRPRLQA